MSSIRRCHTLERAKDYAITPSHGPPTETSALPARGKHVGVVIEQGKALAVEASGQVRLQKARHWSSALLSLNQNDDDYDNNHVSKREVARSSNEPNNSCSCSRLWVQTSLPGPWDFKGSGRSTVDSRREVSWLWLRVDAWRSEFLEPREERPRA